MSGTEFDLFLRERCVIGKRLEVEASALFDAYQTWCDARGVKAKSATWLGRQMTQRFEREKNTAGRRCYIGVATIIPAINLGTQVDSSADASENTSDSLASLIDRILQRQERRTLRSVTQSRAMQAIIVRLSAALDGDETTLRAVVAEVLDDLGHAVTWNE